MTPKVAELILALAHELRKSQVLITRVTAEAASFDAGESDILQLAAERIIERVFQASSALPEQNQIEYFGEEPLRFLRGMRNRIAHNYLGVDNQVLRSTIQEDLPHILTNMQQDIDKALRLIKPAQPEWSDQQDWAQQHLGEV